MAATAGSQSEFHGDKPPLASTKNTLFQLIDVHREMTIKSDSRPYFRKLGARVAVLRKSRQMTQEELGRAVGMSQPTIYAYELGDRRMSIVTLDRMARTFGVPLDFFRQSGDLKSIRQTRTSPRWVRQASRLQQLTITEQRFVVRIIDMLERHRHARERRIETSNIGTLVNAKTRSQISVPSEKL